MKKTLALLSLPQSWLWEAHRAVLGVSRAGDRTPIRGPSRTTASPDSLWNITGITTRESDSPTRAVRPDGPQPQRERVRAVRTAAAALPRSLGPALRTPRGPSGSPLPRGTRWTRRVPERSSSTCWHWTQPWPRHRWRPVSDRAPQRRFPLSAKWPHRRRRSCLDWSWGAATRGKTSSCSSEERWKAATGSLERVHTKRCMSALLCVATIKIHYIC